MGYPKLQTVGDLLSYLQNQLDAGVVQKDSKVLIEMYALTAEETILKDHEDQLDYHVPDEINDETFSFRMGVWSGPQDPKQDGAAYVALSCYLVNQRLKDIAEDKLT